MGLTLGGLDLQPADGRWRFWMPEGIDDVPQVRGDSQVVPFKRGRIPGQRTPDRRAIVLKGHLDTADIRAAIDELKSVLSASDASQVLVWEDPDGFAGDRWTTVVIQSVVAQVSGHVRFYSIELSADPFWYSAHAVVTITPTTNDFTHTFDAGGTADIRDVRVEVDGASVAAIGVKNDLLNVGFTHPALIAADDLVVDSGARTVLLNSVTARANLALLTDNSHGEYFRLSPGSNTVRITGRPAVVRLYFDSVWL